MKFVITALAALLGSQAFAGTSATTLACSSADGRYVVSGILPGFGEEDIELHVMNRENILNYHSENTVVHITAEMKLEMKVVKIVVKQDGQMRFQLDSVGPASTHMKKGVAGIGGSFLAKMTGMDPGTFDMMKAPVVLRCYASDAI